MKKPQKSTISPSHSAGRIWLYGKHAVIAALQNPARKHHQLLVTRNAGQELEEEERIAGYNRKTKFFVTDSKFIDNTLPPGAVHQGIALETSPLPDTGLEDFIAKQQGKARSCLVVLDQVTDPHNVGAILRSATAFGADAVITPRNNAAQENGTLAKAACGGLEYTPLIKVTNLVAALSSLKEAGYWCIGMDSDTDLLLDDHCHFPKTVLVLGAEGKGLRRLTREHCDLMVKLPTTGKIRSLNVSNAAAIALYAVGKGESRV